MRGAGIFSVFNLWMSYIIEYSFVTFHDYPAVVVLSTQPDAV